MSYYQYYPLVCTAKDTQSQAASGSACITVSNTITGRVLQNCPCGWSPAACWAVLQRDAQLKPQADHPSHNPVSPSAGWERKDQLYLWQPANTALAKLCSPTGRRFWLTLWGTTRLSCMPTVQIPGQDTPKQSVSS